MVALHSKCLKKWTLRKILFEASLVKCRGKALQGAHYFVRFKIQFLLKQVFIKSKFRTRGLAPKMPFEVRFFSLQYWKSFTVILLYCVCICVVELLWCLCQFAIEVHRILSDPNFIIVWSLVKLFPTDNIRKVQRHFLLLHLYLWKLNFREGPANFNSQLKYSALETFIRTKTSIITDQQ